MNLNSLNLQTTSPTTTITINDQQINILNYLPVSDKVDLIEITLQKAEMENHLYNQTLLDIFFDLNILYLYTDIEFSDEDREDELKLYDILETNGVIEEVVKNMNEDEYNYLRNTLMIQKGNRMRYRTTAAAAIQSFIQDLPRNAAAAQEIVNSFSPEKYQEVLNFAQAANGGRSIVPVAAPVNE